MPKPQDILNKVKRTFQSIARQKKIDIHNVTTPLFWSKATDVTEWDIRKLGGLEAIKIALFGAPIIKQIKDETKPVQFKQVNDRKVIINTDGHKQPLVTPHLENFTVKEAFILDLFKKAKLKMDGIFKAVFLTDFHIPEHDVAAVNAVMKFLADYKPNGIILGGDFVECESVTHWPSNSAKPQRLVPEAKCARTILDQIEHASGGKLALMEFMEGNHEDWINQYLIDKIPEYLDGINELGIDLSISKILDLKKKGWHLIPLNQILKIGNAHFIHGFYINDHHAKKHLGVFNVNIYYGHTHDVQKYAGVTVRGLKEAESCGCLRKLQASFMKGKPNNWVHNITWFEFRSDGNYTKYSAIIINGKFSFNGKIYDGNI